MKFIFLAGIVLYCLISLIFAVSFFKHYKKDYSKKTTNLLALCFFPYSSLVFFSIYWFLRSALYNPIDFLLIFSFCLFVQLAVFYMILYSFRRDKKIFFYFLAYIICFVSLMHSVIFSLIVFIVVSYFLFFILFLYINNYFKDISKIGNIGFFYSLVSIILFLLVLFNLGDAYYYALISSVIFIFLLADFLSNISDFHLRSVKNIKIKEEKYLLLFFKYFVFMIALSSIVLISTIGIREAGHVIASKFFNCQSKIILYEDGHYPHSELICPNEDGNILSLISGILLPLVIALVLLISGGIFMKEIALLIIGFDLLSSYQDFIDLGLNGNLILFTTLTGISFLFLGIMLLARTRMGDYD